MRYKQSKETIDQTLIIIIKNKENPKLKDINWELKILGPNPRMIFKKYIWNFLSNILQTTASPQQDEHDVVQQKRHAFTSSLCAAGVRPNRGCIGVQ